MGMFDSIQFEKLFCCFCGFAIENDDDWQTKDGDCLLDIYTQEEFESKYFKTLFYKISGRCPECKKYLRYELFNESQECRNFAEKQAQEFIESIANQQTSEHPNHPFAGGSFQGYFVYNAHCKICKELKVENGDLPPDVSPEFLLQIEQRWEEFKNKSKKVFSMLDELQDYD